MTQQHTKLVVKTASISSN